MLLTNGNRKSHSSSGYKNGAINPPLAASTWIPVSHLRIKEKNLKTGREPVKID